MIPLKMNAKVFERCVSDLMQKQTDLVIQQKRRIEQEVNLSSYELMMKRVLKGEFC